MTNGPRTIPVECLEIKPNTEKLPKIFQKLNINDEKITYEITKNIENHKNNYIIIELLEELTDMIGTSKTSMNEYKWYCINRDLKQHDSPIFCDNNPSFDTVQNFPHNHVTLTVGELIHDYFEIQDKKGMNPFVIGNPITKGEVLQIIQYLLDHDVIYTFDLSDIFNDPANTLDELHDVLEYDHEIRCLKIF